MKSRMESCKPKPNWNFTL